MVAASPPPPPLGVLGENPVEARVCEHKTPEEHKLWWPAGLATVLLVVAFAFLRGLAATQVEACAGCVAGLGLVTWLLSESIARSARLNMLVGKVPKHM
jgi:hypothetical protein